MTAAAEAIPPRRIEPGDIVAVFSEHLGEWTAAQITDLDPGNSTAGVLDLDWSGPEPECVADLGDVQPLRLTHHSWSGTVSHCNYEWVLPRSFTVLGSLPPLHDQRSNSYGRGWGVGLQLLLQRRWDDGDRESWSDPQAMACTGAELDLLLEQPPTSGQPVPGQLVPDQPIRRLTVRAIESLDCERLVARFPLLTALTLAGRPGTLSQASRLNELAALKRISIDDLFGMDASDCLTPSRMPAVESVQLHSVPADYATSMRSAWRPEVASGTYLDIRKPRKPEWITENRDNPLREWDGDDHIPRAAYKKALKQYKQTRDSVLAALSGAPTADLGPQLFEIGERYGEAFNELDERYGIIETIERELLFDILVRMVRVAEVRLGMELPWARESLIAGTESVRDW